jgi:FkbM family methyltransferase
MSLIRSLGKSVATPLLRPFRLPATWAFQRGYLPAGARTLLPWRWALEPFPIYGLDSVSCRWTPTEFDAIGQRIFWEGLRDWEKETVPVMLAEMRKARTFFDIGANCGIYSVLGGLLNPQLRVVAFEPVPKVFAALSHNIRQNGLESRVLACHLALGEANGQVPFHEADDATMSSMALTGYQAQGGRVISVECRTLDAVTAEHRLEPDFIKIDVEGFEYAVLGGARHVLEHYRPRIVLEANPGDPVERTGAILASHGYRFENLTDRGPVARPELVAVDEFRNWLCVPPGPPSQ